MMRRSLVEFLRGVLRGDVEVRPEQNVDETHPVDIKVTWELTNRRAIIEIKWLGKSQRDDGKIVNDYNEARAREGAKQLSEYLDASRQGAPTQITRGYLVIFDARRHRLNENSVTVDVKRGAYYRDKEIIFDPKYHELRDDFEPPFRMFIEPVYD